MHAWIRDGKVPPGEPLPPIRKLASDFDVAKGTVVRALSHLQEAGLIERQGRRLHVARQRRHAVPGDVPGDRATDRRPGPPFADASRRGPSPWAGAIAVLSAVGPGSGTHRSPDWRGRVVHGVLTAAQNADRHTMLLHPGSLTPEDAARIAEGGPVGCIVSSGLNEAEWVLPLMDEAGVAVNGFADELPDRYPSVQPDHRGGARAIVHWLHDRGRRRVLRYYPHHHSTKRRPPWLVHRDAGYEQAVGELGLPRLGAVEFTRPSEDGLNAEATFALRRRLAAGHLAEHLLGDDPADAILCASDRHAFEVAAACRLLGREPHEDVLIAGYDDYAFDAAERRWEPTLPAVTVNHDYVEIGRALVSQLLDPDADRLVAVRPYLKTYRDDARDSRPAA